MLGSHFRFLASKLILITHPLLSVFSSTPLHTHNSSSKPLSFPTLSSTTTTNPLLNSFSLNSHSPPPLVASPATAGSLAAASLGLAPSPLVGCAGEDDERDGRLPHEESRTLCNETMEDEDEPSARPGTAAWPAALAAPPLYQHDDAACCPAA